MKSLLPKGTQQFFDTLLSIGAFQEHLEQPKALAEHRGGKYSPLSTFYINLRDARNKKPGPLRDSHYETMALEMFARVRKNNISYDGIAGIPNAGVPFAHAFMRAHERQLNTSPYLIRMRKHERKDGAASFSIEPTDKPYAQGREPKILIIDDLISTYTTKLAAVKALQKAGFAVAGVAVYIDREQGGARALREKSIPFTSVHTISNLLDHYEQTEKIPKDRIARHRAYLRSVRA